MGKLGLRIAQESNGRFSLISCHYDSRGKIREARRFYELCDEFSVEFIKKSVDMIKALSDEAFSLPVLKFEDLPEKDAIPIWEFDKDDPYLSRGNLT